MTKFDRLSAFQYLLEHERKHRIVRRFLKQNVEAEIIARAPRRRIFEAVTTAIGLNGWLTDDAEVILQPGGEIIFRRIDSEEVWENRAEIVEVVNLERLIFKWDSPCREYQTTVVMDFELSIDWTTIRIVESGFEDTTTGLKNLTARAIFWGDALTRLKCFTDHGHRI